MGYNDPSSETLLMLLANWVVLSQSSHLLLTSVNDSLKFCSFSDGMPPFSFQKVSHTLHQTQLQIPTQAVNVDGIGWRNLKRPGTLSDQSSTKLWTLRFFLSNWRPLQQMLLSF